MASSEGMTSSTRSFAYSYRLVKKCFVKICETSKCHNFLICQPIFIRFSLFCSQNVTLSSGIKVKSVLEFRFKTLSQILYHYWTIPLCAAEQWRRQDFFFSVGGGGTGSLTFHIGGTRKYDFLSLSTMFHIKHDFVAVVVKSPGSTPPPPPPFPLDPPAARFLHAHTSASASYTSIKFQHHS